MSRPNAEGVAERFQPQIANRQVSADGSRKYVLRLHDGNLVETVAIPHGDPNAPHRLTVCFSTQVGCAMGCAFCATGRRGFSRNLEAAEMFWQVELVQNDFGKRADSAVAMGQGEPLCNYEELCKAIFALNRAGSPGIDERNLAVSTCGILHGIRSFTSDGVPAMLAVSLHAARQELRDELMPGVRAFPLHSLHDELARYNVATGKRVVVQYLMLDGVNDNDEDLEALERFCRGLDVVVSLLRFNRVEGIPFSPSPLGRMVLWSMELNRRGIETALNKPRGSDIAAACGQLENRTSEQGASG